jgi:hypothetical protein
MRRFLLISLFLNILLGSTAFSSEPFQLPSPEQVTKLVDAAWRLPPERMDITYYQLVKSFVKSEREVRESFGEAFCKLRGLKQDSLSPKMIEARDRNVEINVQKFLKQQIVGQKSKRRLRFDPNRLRIDFTFDNRPEIKVHRGQEEETIAAREISFDTPYETSVIQIPDKDSGFFEYNYFHAQKNMQSRKIKNKDMRIRNEFSRFKIMPDLCVLLLQNALGDMSDGGYEPNKAKIDNLRLGTLDKLTISIQTDKAVAKDHLKMIQRDSENNPIYRHEMIVDKDDYAKIYYYEVQNIKTGQPILIRDIEKFDSQGFPDKATIIDYGVDGNILSEKEYTFIDVKIDISIPDVAFDVDKIDEQ